MHDVVSFRTFPTTQSLEFIEKGIESGRPQLSKGYRPLMRSSLSKSPYSEHMLKESPQKSLLHLFE